ncbi:beta-lactamase family protein [Sphingomonas sp. PL-96]|uniref:serine hydrolase domain-containing protein n=1 Tax=Sphingomonas sp. PL-96 TaxID=2887201 RepID=UPI001E580788|nr:serine hydrolase domain-containing protein [Sphingomonas sp. PL-96]MCC2977701.1 beta-lactamase family protein [Sphingomonas sp. PL-96]
MTARAWMAGLAALALVAPPIASAQVAASPAPALPSVEALAQRYVATGRAPGIAIALGGAGDTRFVAKGVLSDGGAPATPDSLWRVYSMTKPITAMAAMMLVEDGKLRLDQPVSDFLPKFAKMRVLTDPEHGLASRPAARPITIRHLLTHTAGLGYTIVTKGPLLHEYERLGIVPAAVNAKVEAEMLRVRPKSLAEFADRLATLPLIADPGSRWSYSVGLDLMGRVIEVASGMSFERFLQTRMFGPLGMTSTYWQVPPDQAGRLATNYVFVGDRAVPFDPGATSIFLQAPSFPYGGAGLVSSARDYDRFLHMLQNRGTLDGKRVMKPETVALAMSNLLPAGVTFGGVDASTGGTAGPKMGFGAGGSVTLEDAPGGLGRGTYAWGGAAGTLAFVDPGRQLRGTVMVNYFPADRWPLRADLTRALMTDLAR